MAEQHRVRVECNGLCEDFLQRHRAQFGIDQLDLVTCVEEGTEAVDEVLCLIGGSGLAIDEFLEDLDRLPDDDLAGLLYRSWIVDWAGTIPLSPFWSDESARGRAWNWYVSPGLLKRMQIASHGGNHQARAVAEVIARTCDET